MYSSDHYSIQIKNTCTGRECVFPFIQRKGGTSRKSMRRLMAMVSSIVLKEMG